MSPFRWHPFFIFLQTLGLIAFFWTGCSPEPEEPVKNDAQSITASPQAPPKSPPPPPPIQLTLCFEFEGIAPRALDRWIKTFNRPVNILQQQIKQSEDGSMETPGDLYLISPRLIPDFVTNSRLAPVNCPELLTPMNPVFTNHRFDPENVYTVPHRWTPMIRLTRPAQAKENVHSEPSSEILIPDDPLMQRVLFSDPGLSGHPGGPPRLPDPGSYRQTWDRFLNGPVHEIWIPAACTFRHIGTEIPEGWQWTLPTSKSAVFFDHLALSASTEHGDIVRDLIAHLSSKAEQDRLMDESGYFSVMSLLGAETAAAPVPLPRDDWLNRSAFMLEPAFVAPPPDRAPSPSRSPEHKPMVEPLPAPESIPQQ